MQTSTEGRNERPGSGPISSGEAADFARHVAGLAKAGLPLGAGLRALADEMPGTRLFYMLRAVADDVDSGESLEDALAAQGPRFPGPLRGLIAAGTRSGRLAEALGRFLELDDLSKALRRRLAVALIYPALMIATSFAIFVFVAMVATHGFESIFADFGMQIPLITKLLLSATRGFANAGWWVFLSPVLGVVLIWLAMRLTLGPADRRRLLHAVPLLGPLAQDAAMAQFCPVLALLLESEVPLGEALRLAAESSPDAAMADTIRKAADDVDAGRSLAEAVTDRKPFPHGFSAFLAWAEGNRGLVDSLRLSAENFETRARSRAEYVARFCNVVTMTLVLWWIGLTIVALFLPLLNLMNALGGPGPIMGGWVESIKVAVIGLLTMLAVGAVLVLIWPSLHRVASTEAKERAEDSPIPMVNRYWYLAGMGWSLIGVTTVLLILHICLRMFLRDMLPPWWTDDIGPFFDVLGVAIAGTGLVLVIFAAISAQWARRRVVKAANRKAPASIPRVRFRLRGIRFGLRHMMFAMAPLALMMVLAREFGWSTLAVVVLLIPPLVVVIAFIALTDRRMLQRESLLQVMAMAAREERPLGPAIAAFSETCQGGYRRKVAGLAHRLENGESLPRALNLAPGVLTRSAETVARVGWETGTLSRMLDDAIAANAAEKSARVVAVGSILYPACILAVVMGVGMFLTTFAAPVMVAIFRDFQVPLPEPSRTIFAASMAWVAPVGRLGIEAGIVVGVIAGVCTAILVGGAVVLGRRLIEWIPLFDRITNRRHSAVIYRAIAAAIEVGQTMPAVLARLGASYPRPWVRARLRWAAERVERGDPWASALRSTSLMTPSDAVLLGAAERVGNLSWALRETASSGERRLTYRLLAIGQVVRTLVIVALGMIVLLFGVAYFQPLITLIEAMAGSIG